MALLSEAQRERVTRALMRRLSRDLSSLGVTKAQLRGVVDALDGFMDANAAAINNAIPQPQRAAMATAQKALVLMYVTWQRYGEDVPGGE